MKNQKRIRDYGINIGILETGKLNSITDVKGVKVGHVTLKDENIMTGVTAILPHENNMFKEKVLASSYVINGFGKTTGLVQLEELGNIETPIILTNTLSVGTCYTGLVKYMLNSNEDIGKTTGTINPIICECNDGFLNDIRGLYVKEEHVTMAINAAESEFLEGNVGSGSGMSCYKLKGGIGTSSRKFGDKKQYTLGALVMSNTGHINDFLLDCHKKGVEILKKIEEDKETDKGSIIIIIATDAPFSERQLKRICKRAVVGLARTGSYIHNGSGDIAIGFTTVNKIKHYEDEEVINIKMYNEDKIDVAFRAVGEAVEEAILNSMVTSTSVIGRDGHERKSLKDFMKSDGAQWEK